MDYEKDEIMEESTAEAVTETVPEAESTESLTETVPEAEALTESLTEAKKAGGRTKLLVAMVAVLAVLLVIVGANNQRLAGIAKDYSATVRELEEVGAELEEGSAEKDERIAELETELETSKNYINRADGVILDMMRGQNLEKNWANFKVGFMNATSDYMMFSDEPGLITKLSVMDAVNYVVEQSDDNLLDQFVDELE
jgi:uncharacterized protein HemX